jgi:hypothetical protein
MSCPGPRRGLPRRLRIPARPRFLVLMGTPLLCPQLGRRTGPTAPGSRLPAPPPTPIWRRSSPPRLLTSIVCSIDCSSSPPIQATASASVASPLSTGSETVGVLSGVRAADATATRPEDVSFLPSLTPPLPLSPPLSPSLMVWVPRLTGCAPGPTAPPRRRRPLVSAAVSSQGLPRPTRAGRLLLPHRPTLRQLCCAQRARWWLPPQALGQASSTGAPHFCPAAAHGDSHRVPYDRRPGAGVLRADLYAPSGQ